jgi:hypothetical protein
VGARPVPVFKGNGRLHAVDELRRLRELRLARDFPLQPRVEAVLLRACAVSKDVPGEPETAQVVAGGCVTYQLELMDAVQALRDQRGWGTHISIAPLCAEGRRQNTLRCRGDGVLAVSSSSPGTATRGVAGCKIRLSSAALGPGPTTRATLRALYRPDTPPHLHHCCRAASVFDRGWQDPRRLTRHSCYLKQSFSCSTLFDVRFILLARMLHQVRISLLATVARVSGNEIEMCERKNCTCLQSPGLRSHHAGDLFMS